MNDSKDERSDGMNNNPIGILDSGIGGISVLNEIRKLLPNENYIYYGDSLNNPYGDKTKDELFLIVSKIVDMLIKEKCKIIVIACNTATMLLINDLRRIYSNIIFVGTEPAIKVAYDHYKDKNVLVMATPGTIKSERLLTLSNMYYQKNRYFLECDHLAHLIETRDSSLDNYINELLYPFKSKHIDVVVLGCTHYPFIKDRLAKVFKDSIFIDGNQGISKMVKHILDTKKLNNSSLQTGKVSLYNSCDSKIDLMNELLDK